MSVLRAEAMTSLHLAAGLLLVIAAPQDFNREHVVDKIRALAQTLGCQTIRVEAVDYRRATRDVVLHVRCLDERR